ncbi:MAG: thiamine pyrophosphate-dependent enzyme [Candidatus Thorarchaeota archaeon]
MKKMDEESTSLVMMSGNEAMARGALEAGIGFCASYPGTPATDITEYIMQNSAELGIHVEWSTNEKVALEAAAGASWAGIPALCPMKSLGLNVASDFLLTMNLSGSGTGGLVIIVGDDPMGHSTSTEQDSRFYAKAALIPLLEPSGYQDAKDTVSYAFDLSRRFEIPVIVRSTTRLSHSRGLVKLGKLKPYSSKGPLKIAKNLFNVPNPHLERRALQQKLADIADEFQSSPLNKLLHKEDSELTVIASGISQRYAEEALDKLGAESKSILGLITTHPIPRRLIETALSGANAVLFLEEIDPFLEDEVRVLATTLNPQEIGRLYGKRTGTVPAYGEMNSDIAISAVRDVLGLKVNSGAGVSEKTREDLRKLLVTRPLTFCAGCTHRNVYWAIRKVRQRLNGKLFVTGDIGCYSLGVFYDEAMNTLHSMGSGIGIASGLGQLQEYGLEEKVIAVAGDSTFLHACIPGLINARHKNSNVTFLILDNSTTAMTGFQKHPGEVNQPEGLNRVQIEKIVQAIEPDFYVVGDATDLPAAIDLIHDTVKKEGLKVILFDSICRLHEQREGESYDNNSPVSVEADLCRGEDCKICVYQFGCVALDWDSETHRPIILDHVCVRCGACVMVCPHDAIRQG